MSSPTMPPNLKLVLEYLNAARELHRYLEQGDIKKDLDRSVEAVLRRPLQERLPLLRSWQFEADKGFAYWYPEAWRLRRYYVALCVILPHPLGKDHPDEYGDDDNPSVSLYVPLYLARKAAFGKRSTAAKCVRALLDEGFELAAENDLDEEYPLFKFVNWLEPDGTFDEAKLIERIAVEAAKIIHVETEITEAIHQTQAKPTHKGSKRGQPSKV